MSGDDSGNDSARLFGFGSEALSQLSHAFPLRPAVVSHGLAGHPLFSVEALAAAAQSLDPSDVEVRSADNVNGGGFAFANADTRSHGPGIAETIRTVADTRQWVMLRSIEKIPDYAALLSGLLTQISPLTRRFGPALRMRGFVFVSPPEALTPFHFDPEFNILFQIAGQKRFATCPDRSPWLVEQTQMAFHQTGDNLLAWEDTMEEGATIHALSPGKALFVPYKFPHWVKVGDEPSVSVSLTWSCARTLELEQAWQLAAWARKRGMTLAPPPSFPGRAPIRAFARRAIGKLGLG